MVEIVIGLLIVAILLLIATIITVSMAIGYRLAMRSAREYADRMSNYYNKRCVHLVRQRSLAAQNLWRLWGERDEAIADAKSSAKQARDNRVEAIFYRDKLCSVRQTAENAVDHFS